MSVNGNQTIPNGWVHLSQFCNRYKFISGPSLSDLVSNNEDFFNHWILRSKRSVYIDPVRVAVFFENGLSTSTQLNNQYRSWVASGGHLCELSILARQRINNPAGSINESGTDE